MEREKNIFVRKRSEFQDCLLRYAKTISQIGALVLLTVFINPRSAHAFEIDNLIIQSAPPVSSPPTNSVQNPQFISQMNEELKSEIRRLPKRDKGKKEAVYAELATTVNSLNAAATSPAPSPTPSATPTGISGTTLTIGADYLIYGSNVDQSFQPNVLIGYVSSPSTSYLTEGGKNGEFGPVSFGTVALNVATIPNANSSSDAAKTLLLPDNYSLKLEWGGMEAFSNMDHPLSIPRNFGLLYGAEGEFGYNAMAASISPTTVGAYDLGVLKTGVELGFIQLLNMPGSTQTLPFMLLAHLDYAYYGIGDGASSFQNEFGLTSRDQGAEILTLEAEVPIFGDHTGEIKIAYSGFVPNQSVRFATGRLYAVADGGILLISVSKNFW